MFCYSRMVFKLTHLRVNVSPLLDLFCLFDSLSYRTFVEKFFTKKKTHSSCGNFLENRFYWTPFTRSTWNCQLMPRSATWGALVHSVTQEWRHGMLLWKKTKLAEIVFVKVSISPQNNEESVEKGGTRKSFEPRHSLVLN